MTEEEARQAFDEIRKQGADDQDILEFLYHLYHNKEINEHQLEALVDILGYEVDSQKLAAPGESAI